MATVTEPEPNLDQTLPPYPVKRFTVDEYHKMIAAGVFADDERFELLEGWIIPKMSRNPPHDALLMLIQGALFRSLPPGWDLRNQSAITTRDSEPEPDFTVVRGDGRAYFDRHPAPADIGLAIEVAESSLGRDQTLKARIYARARVPIYWIVNVANRCVEVHTDPSGPAKSPSYRSREVVGIDGELPLILDGREVARIAAKDILP
jgi:Uma2 family endonuclease